MLKMLLFAALHPGPFLFLTFNPSPLHLNPSVVLEQKYKPGILAIHIPWLRTNPCGAQAEASPALEDPAFQESNVLSVYISACQS